MPKRTDIKKILIIGSGPIVIGQACEFDYSGTQGCKALREEGYTVVLINSNPATIMTDPEFGDQTYVEPINLEYVTKIIEKERPDALLPTLGGQTALNTAMELFKSGVLKKYNVELIGANEKAIAKSEDRSLFKQTMEEIGLDVPRSGFAHSMEEAIGLIDYVGFPAIIRPSFTLGGSGGGIAYNIEEYRIIAERGLNLSPTTEIMIEECFLGWKEFELEVMRDKADNVVIICSIENLDPMGVHTGDSITVAPSQTLTDEEYQVMRDAAIKIIRAIGVDTGGSNIQFAINPENGRMIVIEMNPRVSRSSALASKATGFPIAKIAAKLAVGYRLDELPNDITKKTPASFEPTIDYCVVKIPRFAFEKFPGSQPVLTSQMKSVGETMSIGRTFKEALQKGLRGLETSRYGICADGKEKVEVDDIDNKLRIPSPDRIFYLYTALKMGKTIDEIYDLSMIDKWFLENIREIIVVEDEIKAMKDQIVNSVKGDLLIEDAVKGTPVYEIIKKAKQNGFSDFQMAYLTGLKEVVFRNFRKSIGIKAVFKSVDTCGGEFSAETPYYYSTYEDDNESIRSDKKKIMIIGGGPNRIGQGIEFDYCCVQGLFALSKAGFETIMVNSNPETVSTDYDTADKLYFEPVTIEDVLNIIDVEDPDGVIVQFGGQTPLKIAVALEKAGVKIIGTSPDSIDLAEDRERFGALLNKFNIPQPENGTGRTFEQVKDQAEKIGYPVMVRPSYVLGGRAMQIVYDESNLKEFMKMAIDVSPEHPILIDKFLNEAIEVDVDALCDMKQVVIAAIMEHIEFAGIHSGDSACVIPPRTLSENVLEKIRDYTKKLGIALKVKGLMNIQYAVKNEDVYILEVNPRASRTVPFVSKTIGYPIAKYAARIMAGETLDQIGFTKEIKIDYYSVKEAVLPFAKFPECEVILGPEMRSTGEVMGIDPNFGIAFAKSQAGANVALPKDGAIFISVNDNDKPAVVEIARKFVEMGFEIIATEGTMKFLDNNDIKATKVFKVHEGRPNVVDLLINKKVKLVVNTVLSKTSLFDEKAIRQIAYARNIPCITTMSAARAAVSGIEAIKNNTQTIRSLQDYHANKI